MDYINYVMATVDQRVSTNYHKIKIFLFNLLSAVLRQTDDIISRPFQIVVSGKKEIIVF